MTINTTFVETRIAELGVTKKDLAARCDISAQNISTIIRRGTCEPKTAKKLADGLGVSVTEIIENRSIAYGGQA